MVSTKGDLVIELVALAGVRVRPQYRYIKAIIADIYTHISSIAHSHRVLNMTQLDLPVSRPFIYKHEISHSIHFLKIMLRGSKTKARTSHQ